MENTFGDFETVYAFQYKLSNGKYYDVFFIGIANDEEASVMMEAPFWEWIGNVKSINYFYWTVPEAPEGLNSELLEELSVAVIYDEPYIDEHIELYNIPPMGEEDPMKTAMEGR